MNFQLLPHTNSCDTVPLLLLTMVMLLQETAFVRIFSLKTKKGRGKRTASLPVLPSLSNFFPPIRSKNPAVKGKKIHIFVNFCIRQLVKKGNFQCLSTHFLRQIIAKLRPKNSSASQIFPPLFGIRIFLARRSESVGFSLLRIRYVNKFVFFSHKLPIVSNLYLHNAYHQY
jgi:hypothetical protein